MSRRLRLWFETLLVNALIVSSLYQLFVYLANRRFWLQIPPPPADETPATSVIIPLHGKSLDTLALLHLAAITGPTDDYELLLVLEDEHNPAYANAREVVKHYPDTVRLILSGPAGDCVGKMHQLNAGYQAARGDLIAFVDANVQLSAELWSVALAALTDPAVGAVFAPPLVKEPERLTGSRIPTGGEMLTALHVNHARTAGLPFAALNNRIRAMASGFIVVRRQVLAEAGGLLHLLDEAHPAAALGRSVRELGYRIVALPVPALIVPAPESVNEATTHLLRRLVLSRVTNLLDFIAWPFTNPLTVGFVLGFITEREGRWWGRRTWWGFLWLRMALAYELDRIRFGRGFNWTAYAQLTMLDTFIAPVLWLRALFQRTISWRGRTYQVEQGGKATPVDDRTGQAPSLRET